MLMTSHPRLNHVGDLWIIIPIHSLTTYSNELLRYIQLNSLRCITVFSSGQTVLWDLFEHVCKASAASDYSLGVGVYYFSRSQSTFHSHTHKEHLISRQQQAPLTVGSNSIYCRTKNLISTLLHHRCTA